MATFWATLGKIGLLFIPTYGHTGYDDDDVDEGQKVDPANKKLFALFFILSVTKYPECITITLLVGPILTNPNVSKLATKVSSM